MKRSKLTALILSAMLITVAVLTLSFGYFYVSMATEINRLEKENTKLLKGLMASSMLLEGLTKQTKLLKGPCKQTKLEETSLTTSTSQQHNGDYVREHPSSDPVAARLHTAGSDDFLLQFPACSWVKDGHYRFPYQTRNPGFEATVKCVALTAVASS